MYYQFITNFLILILSVPESFADHILVGDAVVRQRLVPDGVECVVQGLGSEFIRLEHKSHPLVNVHDRILVPLTAK